MLFEILAALSVEAGLKYASVPGDLFQRGIAPRATHVDIRLRATGFCYGGFRFFPPYANQLIDTAPAILLVRDPRDALVSLYYSIRDSHPLPGTDGSATRHITKRRERARSMSIDAWVVENHGSVAESLGGYLAQGFASRANVVVYRYEDVIYRKREWIEDVTEFLGWDVPRETIDAVARGADRFPAKEDPGKHVRQVHPGNHRTALTPETAEALSSSLQFILAAFGYDHH